MSSHRRVSGGLIDRKKAIRFEFDGQVYAGHPGDTLASALLASGQWLMARSFKYHRPRSVLTAGAAEPNALVTTGSEAHTEPNVRATMLEIHDGLVATPQNCWPSLRRDVGAVNGLFGPLLAAGFYYKTFMWPASFWERCYEPLIRRAAGLGKASALPDPQAYDKCWAHCDVLVIGAGPSGISAALAAARTGASIILVDEQHCFGGELAGRSGLDANEQQVIGTDSADQWLDSCLAELDSLPNARVMLRTTVFGHYDSGVFGALERVGQPVAERLWRIVAGQCIMATGAQERPLVFDGNDRPGILLASALQTYVDRYAVMPGQSVGIITNNEAGYRSAESLLAAGVPVKAIIDQRADRSSSSLVQQLSTQTRVINNATVVATKGRQRLREVTIQSATGTERLALDTLGMAGGFSPVIHLACQRGAKPRWDEQRLWFAAPEDHDGLFACGAAAGHESLPACIEHGERIARQCLSQSGSAVSQTTSTNTTAHPSWHVGGSGTKAFVDFQNDVVATDLSLAVREGYGHVEMAKRYTTTGMATDQGKSGNVNAIGLLAQARGISCAAVGTTTFRPFYTPVSFGALAGAFRSEDFAPRRHSPLHEWAKSLGASFVESGLWDRAAWFPREGETRWRESVDREVQTVRRGVGLTDVSTLGKIELFGPDSTEFLNRIYCNKFAKLPVGKARYGLMLREDGFILDDGTTSRLNEQHYLITTTTGAAGEVLTHLEWCHQVLWPELDLCFAPVSDQWAQMAVAGPKSRDVLQAIIAESISDEAMPFLAARQVTLKDGSVARLFRISFSGELGFELAVPANKGSAVAQWLMTVGESVGIAAYGTEAMAVMRIEKGFVTHAEIDGRVTPSDLGMGRLAANDKSYIGQALLQRDGLNTPDRGQLVGLRPLDKQSALQAGAHLYSLPETSAGATHSVSEGHVTSACYSPTIGSPIALALLSNGRERIGQSIEVRDGLRGNTSVAQICQPDFLADCDNWPSQPNTESLKLTADETGESREAVPMHQAQGPISSTALEQFNAISAELTLSIEATPALMLHFGVSSGATETDKFRRHLTPDKTLWINQTRDDQPNEGNWIDQSDARCRWVLHGPATCEILARGTSINLSSTSLLPGHAQTTLLGRINVVLTRLDDQSFEIIVNRSFAQALLRQLSIWAEANA
ncbi:MAG: sarcosine oxidase subunit alpha family protein [Burkholderiaceae bacterium]